MHQFMTPQTTGEIGSTNCAPARTLAAAVGGWMSEKHRLLAEEQECFYLTSIFIELDGLEIPS